MREVLVANLNRLRRAAGYPQGALAHDADIDRNYVSALERCQYAATIDVLDRIAKVLDVDAADLMERPSKRR